MMVEIRQAQFVNKGAELMLRAILDKMRKQDFHTSFAMVPSFKKAPYAKRSVLGLYQKVQHRPGRIERGMLANLIPRRIREKYGIVLDKEIDVVFDAAGFAYGDQWGDNNTVWLAHYCKHWKKKGKKIIFLPQAFGPFTSPRVQKALISVADDADLIFARERISYDHLTAVVGERENIKIAPDFTNLIEGIVPPNFDCDNNRFCIVPNYRMIDKTKKEVSEAYVPFLIKCAQYLLEKKQKPFVLIHESKKDLSIAEKLRTSVGDHLPIVTEENPLFIKGMLGVCAGTMGSRYHGLVSALSQGIPAIGTGWSHKYQKLFEDYGYREGLIDVRAQDKEVFKHIDRIINMDTGEQLKNDLLTKAGVLKNHSEKMWQDVFQIMGAKNLPGPFQLRKSAY